MYLSLILAFLHSNYPKIQWQYFQCFCWWNYSN